MTVRPIFPVLPIALFSVAPGARSPLSGTVSTAANHRVQPVAEIAPQGQRVGLNVRF